MCTDFICQAFNNFLTKVHKLLIALRVIALTISTLQGIFALQRIKGQLKWKNFFS